MTTSRRTAEPPVQPREVARDQLDLVAALLAEIVDRLETLPKRLTAEMQTAKPAVALSASDRRFLAGALPAIAGAVGDAAWSLRDLGVCAAEPGSS